MNWVYATNSNILIILSLQPDNINLCYFKFRLFRYLLRTKKSVFITEWLLSIENPAATGPQIYFFQIMFSNWRLFKYQMQYKREIFYSWYRKKTFCNKVFEIIRQWLRDLSRFHCDVAINWIQWKNNYFFNQIKKSKNIYFCND